MLVCVPKYGNTPKTVGLPFLEDSLTPCFHTPPCVDSGEMPLRGHLAVLLLRQLFGALLGLLVAPQKAQRSHKASHSAHLGVSVFRGIHGDLSKTGLGVPFGFSVNPAKKGYPPKKTKPIGPLA